VPPERRWRPIRWLICTIATALAFGLSCGLAFVLDGIERWQKADPERARQLDRLLAALHPKRWFSSESDFPSV
jgi:hypothetical protein